MGFSRKNIAIVNQEFEEKRNNAIYLQNQRLNEAYLACPELREIDRVLSCTCGEIFTLAMQGKEAFEKGLSELQEKNEALQRKRAEILIKHGFKPDYTDMEYECSLCHDTGYIGTKLCSCYRKALIEKGYESSGILNLLKTQSFESFSLDMYDESSYNIMKKNYKKLQKFVANFETEKPCLLLVGGTGLGKTHLSTSVAKELIEKGYDVVYEIAQNIFSDFDADFFRDRFSDEELRSTKYFDCDLLIIDDLGTEIVTSHSTSYLYNIINTRINKKLPIIISSNLKGKEIEKLYHERITSRLFGEFTIVKFEGGDIRNTKVKK